MSNLVVEKQHGTSPDEAKAMICAMETKLKDRYGVSLRWQGHRADVAGKGVSGEVRVDSSRVVVDLKLGLLLRPLAGRIRDGVQSHLDKELG